MRAGAEGNIKKQIGNLSQLSSLSKKKRQISFNHNSVFFFPQAFLSEELSFNCVYTEQEVKTFPQTFSRLTIIKNMTKVKAGEIVNTWKGGRFLFLLLKSKKITI